ncbi:hypothetical protein E2C01_035583 [Portunus trituberculatus]|uniref:Uncharacterized protein n=1 Tax=Portunus trituberculatus TaxID=210409 RepID=A0A5B7F688_PORTR|nr:hypothetical protein [Portunus trituberculatus]
MLYERTITGVGYSENIRMCLIHCIASACAARHFRHLAKSISNNYTSSFPSLFHPDGTTAISSVYKAELFTQILARNSTLDDSGLVLPSSSL